MCSRVKCRKCGKATWSGCGNHVDMVMAGVPKSQRCTCAKDARNAAARAAKLPPAETVEKTGFFTKIFGKK